MVRALGGKSRSERITLNAGKSESREMETERKRKKRMGKREVQRASYLWLITLQSNSDLDFSFKK